MLQLFSCSSNTEAMRRKMKKEKNNTTIFKKLKGNRNAHKKQRAKNYVKFETSVIF
jgi:hypothetical protein